MKCPYCDSEKVGVIDTRKYDTCISRIRFCYDCQKSFQTIEEVAAKLTIEIHIPTDKSS